MFLSVYDTNGMSFNSTTVKSPNHVEVLIFKLPNIIVNIKPLTQNVFHRLLWWILFLGHHPKYPCTPSIHWNKARNHPTTRFPHRAPCKQPQPLTVVQWRRNSRMPQRQLSLLVRGVRSGCLALRKMVTDVCGGLSTNSCSASSTYTLAENSPISARQYSTLIGPTLVTKLRGTAVILYGPE